MRREDRTSISSHPLADLGRKLLTGLRHRLLMLAKRASTWPRDHFCRSTMAPRSSWPTTWNECLPISMPITAIVLSSFWDMACSLSLAPLPSILLLVGREHGRAIPLTDKL